MKVPKRLKYIKGYQNVRGTFSEQSQGSREVRILLMVMAELGGHYLDNSAQ